MPQLFRPPPPKTHGFKTAVILVVLAGWGVSLLLTSGKESASAPPTVQPTPTPVEFVEIDLRGPYYDKGRLAGYEHGNLARAKGLSLPDAKVLDFQSREAAAQASLTAENEVSDFAAGWQSGATLAWKKTAP